MSEYQYTGPKTFEVSIPASRYDYTDELRAVAAHSGWKLTQIDPIPAGCFAADSMLQQDDLEAVGQAIHDDKRYGTMAQRILDLQRPAIRAVVVRRRNNLTLLGKSTGKMGTPIGPTDLTAHEVNNRVRGVFAATSAPFVPTCNPSAADQYVVSSDYATPETLKRFGNSRHYDEHQLHGLVGKALDCLNFAAGVETDRVIDEYSEDDYISNGEIWSRARQDGLTEPFRNIGNRILSGIRTQINTGLAPDWGEAIVEGNLEPQKPGQRFTQSQDFSIARQTLRDVSRTVHDQSAPIVGFLFDIADSSPC